MQVFTRSLSMPPVRLNALTLRYEGENVSFVTTKRITLKIWIFFKHKSAIYLLRTQAKTVLKCLPPMSLNACSISLLSHSTLASVIQSGRSRFHSCSGFLESFLETYLARFAFVISDNVLLKRLLAIQHRSPEFLIKAD